MINYKDDDVLVGVLVGWHPMLIEIYAWIYSKYGDKVIITCAHEARDYDSTHDVDPLRAIDIRSWIFNNPQAIENVINDCWIYDPERPEMQVAKYHDTGRGKHIHIQVHANTRKR